MNYGDVLTRAWQITWKYKVLWIFGILAGCGSDGGSGGNGGSSNARVSQDAGSLPPQMERFFDRALTFFERPEVIIGLVVFFLIFIVLAIFLSNVGRIALISGAHQAEEGAETLSFGTLFKEGKTRFWRFFGMNLLISLPFIIAILAIMGIGIFLAFAADSGTNIETAFLAFLPLFCTLLCIIFFFAIVIGIILQQAQNAMVIEELGITDSIRRGWEVLKNNIGHIILMAIILFFISAVAGVVISLPVLVIVIPAMFSFILGQAESMQPLILMGVCLAAYFPIALIANGILTTYAQASWTLTYLQLTQESPETPKDDKIIEYA